MDSFVHFTSVFFTQG